MPTRGEVVIIANQIAMGLGIAWGFTSLVIVGYWLAYLLCGG